MVKLTRIYTGGGDKGQTSLGNGQRVNKHDLRVTAYGSVDEANAILGVARCHISSEEDILLQRVQNDLFDLGADLCVPEQKEGESPPSYSALRVTEAQVKYLETKIDDLNARLDPLQSFILPGGSAASAHLHHARTVVRRAERDVSALNMVEPFNHWVFVYLNRLSDLLFVLARICNDEGKADILWQPGQSQ